MTILRKDEGLPDGIIIDLLSIIRRVKIET